MSNGAKQAFYQTFIHPFIVAILLAIVMVIGFNSENVIRLLTTFENMEKNMEQEAIRREKAELRRFKFEERTEDHMAKIEKSSADTARSMEKTSVLLSTEMKSLNFIVLGKVTQHMVKDEEDKEEINKMLVDHSDRLSILEKGDR